MKLAAQLKTSKCNAIAYYVQRNTQMSTK